MKFDDSEIKEERRLFTKALLLSPFLCLYTYSADAFWPLFFRFLFSSAVRQLPRTIVRSSARNIVRSTVRSVGYSKRKQNKTSEFVSKAYDVYSTANDIKDILDILDESTSVWNNGSSNTSSVVIANTSNTSKTTEPFSLKFSDPINRDEVYTDYASTQIHPNQAVVIETEYPNNNFSAGVKEVRLKSPNTASSLYKRLVVASAEEFNSGHSASDIYRHYMNKSGITDSGSSHSTSRGQASQYLKKRLGE